MVIVKVLGGLGNQMFQYAVAKAVAYKRGDIFKLDITGFKTCKLHKGYRLNLLNIEENIADDDEIKKLKGYDGILRKILNRVGIELSRPSSYYQEREITVFDSNIFNYKDSIYLDGYWQNEEYFIDIRNILLKQFVPKNDLSETAKNFLRKIKATNSVSLHVRRGDYIRNPKALEVHGVCSIEYYKKAVNLIYSKVRNPVFFVFSDDMEWCRKNLHFLKKVTFVEGTGNEIEDVYLMKNCKHNIIANSTFSWWGAWLNENKGNIVVAPKKWFSKEEWRKLTLACKGWVKL